jgi:hypothetical protein
MSLRRLEDRKAGATPAGATRAEPLERFEDDRLGRPDPRRDEGIAVCFYIGYRFIFFFAAKPSLKTEHA